MREILTKENTGTEKSLQLIKLECDKSRDVMDCASAYQRA